MEGCGPSHPWAARACRPPIATFQTGSKRAPPKSLGRLRAPIPIQCHEADLTIRHRPECHGRHFCETISRLPGGRHDLQHAGGSGCDRFPWVFRVSERVHKFSGSQDFRGLPKEGISAPLAMWADRPFAFLPGNIPAGRLLQVSRKSAGGVYRYNTAFHWDG